MVAPLSLPQGQGHQKAHQVAAAGGCKQGPWQGPLAASAPLTAEGVCGWHSLAFPPSSAALQPCRQSMTSYVFHVLVGQGKMRFIPLHAGVTSDI